jgi:formylglycine-generating enzyme
MLFSKNGIDIEWVHIPAGTFMMGSPETEKLRDDDEGPQHKVTLSGFKMSKFAVTFAQYDAFCEATDRWKPSDEGWDREKYPVMNVSWDDATEFAEWMGCRLPTEAEWEYACRAGTSTPFNTGGCISTDLANYDPYPNCIEGSFIQEELQPVGSYAPNAWGLYDMHGNIWEWCSDWYGDYSSASQMNPTGPTSGSERVLRGGSWCECGEYCRSAFRRNYDPSARSNDIGFRLVVPSHYMGEEEVKYLICLSCQTKNSMPKSWTSYVCGSCKKNNIISHGPTKEQIIKNRIIAGITLAAGIFVAVWIVISLRQ